MAADLIVYCVEERCILKFLLKERVKRAEILRKLSTRYEEETLSHSYQYNKVHEGHKEDQETAVSWKGHGKCVL
jgi:hypothetical protein